jgi:hypothetical protein
MIKVDADNVVVVPNPAATVAIGFCRMTVAAVGVAARSHAVDHAPPAAGVATTAPAACPVTVGEHRHRYHHPAGDRVAGLVLPSR